MAKRTASNSRTQRKRAHPAARSRLRFLAWPLGILLFVAGLSATALGVGHARQLLRDFVLASRPSGVEVTGVPEWISQQGARELSATASSLSTTESASAIARTLLTSSWVRSVEVSRKRGALIVVVEYRRPLLAVAWGDRCCYVDREGVALDPDTLSPTSAAGCMTLEGIESRGIPERGRVVDEPSVVIAASLADRIGELAAPLELDRIHIDRSNDSMAPEFLFVTRNGARIVWGRRESDESEKLAQLRSLVENNTRPSPDQVLDLRRTL